MKKIKMYFLILFLLLAALFTVVLGQSSITRKTIDAVSLKNNLLGIPTSRTVLVYLPPSYSTSSIEYPVIYYLLGFGESVDSAPNYKSILDRLITNKQINEVILVAVDSYYFLGGTYYVNSSVTGNWDDFISQEVVSFIDSNYRTIKSSTSRAITGFSMGGFGAIHHAMRHPDIFNVLYSMSPGLYDTNGVNISQSFISSYGINQFIIKQEEFGKMSIPDGLAALKSYAVPANENLQFTYAYRMAFSPNPNKKVPFIDYPYTKSGTELICDSSMLKNYDNGFGNWVEKLKTYKANFLKLKSINIEYGTKDPYKWILTGVPYFVDLLKSQGIPAILDSYSGGHGDILSTRLEMNMLPTCAENLVFDPSIIKFTFSNSRLKTSSIHQNIPQDSGKYTYNFYVYNNGSIDDSLTIAKKLAAGMADSALTCSPIQFNIAAKDSQLVTLKIDPKAIDVNTQYRSYIMFTSKFNQFAKAFILSYSMKVTPTTGVKEKHGSNPTYKLEQNYPNPFNPTTMISYDLPKAGFVTLKIYDSLGREVKTLVNEYAESGNKIVHFDGSQLTSGVYYYQLKTKEYAFTRKMLLMK